jgi:hypothetical protein
VKWFCLAALLGQIAAQAPQPLQRASLTAEIPFESVKSMAE